MFYDTYIPFISLKALLLHNVSHEIGTIIRVQEKQLGLEKANKTSFLLFLNKIDLMALLAVAFN